MLSAWATICARVIIDQVTQNATLIDLVDQLSIPNLPDDVTVISTQLVVVTDWRRDDSDPPLKLTQRLVLKHPDGAEVMDFGQSDLNLESHSLGRVFVAVPAVIARGPGQYRFVVERVLDGRREPIAWTRLWIKRP